MNWLDITEIKRIEERAKQHGFRLKSSKYSGFGEARIGVYPLNDSHPLYSRDAEIFSGDTNQIMCFLMGLKTVIYI